LKLKSIAFNNRYIRLGKDFSVETRPEPVKNPKLISFNHSLAEELELADTSLNADKNFTDATAIFAGNLIPEGAEPIAMAYAGHQFGHFNQQLGDGRAILLGEIDTSDGVPFDIQLKGSGHTTFSRGGDGRAALGPVLREYLLSEAMAKLGVPTTRALAVVTTGEEVVREQLLPGGIITRVSSSFVRVGTFQFLAARDNVEAIKKLADFVIERNYPEARVESNPYAALLQLIVERQAALIAKWMQIGFIHGVMNTDNMSIAGETIDYGPCAFMDFYNHDQVYSSIDRNGRYAYSNQPSIGLWNLTRLAETFLPLLADDNDDAVEIAQDVLKIYVELYEQNWLAGMREKLGLSTNFDDDKALIKDLLNIMAANKADFTLTFYYLSQVPSHPEHESSKEQEAALHDLFSDGQEVKQWLVKWRERLGAESSSDETRQIKMQAVNPVYIPRNHQIEAAIRAGEDSGDFSVFRDLHDVLQNPYVLQSGKDIYMQPPEPDEVVIQTFCGT
jgi:uncharacterized protein YdiU (UPF0061 family)